MLCSCIYVYRKRLLFSVGNAIREHINISSYASDDALENRIERVERAKETYISSSKNFDVVYNIKLMYLVYILHTTRSSFIIHLFFFSY